LTDLQPEPPRRSRRERLARLTIDARPLRSSAAFRRLWLGEGLSQIGSDLSFVVLSYQVYQLTGSTLAVGLLAVARLVPLLTLTLVGGTIADAFDRRSLLLVQQLGMAAASVALAVNAALPHPQLWACFALEFLTTAFFSLGVGAQTALVPQLVEDDQITAAVALASMTSTFAHLAGAAVAGLLIKLTPLWLAYSIDAATFVAVIAAVVLLPRLPAAADAARPGLRSLLEGFRYIRRRRVILAFFLVDTNAMIFGMPLALFPALALHRFGDASAVGYLYAAPSAGAFAVSLFSGPLRHMRRQGLGVVVFAGLWGVAITAFGFATNLWLALVLLACAGGADLVSAVLRNTMLMQLTPNSMLGRLAGIEFAQVASTPALGNLEAGAVASLTSLRFSIVSGGVACVVGTVALALAFPALIRYDSGSRDPASA
jgi:MFS family permease